MSKFRFPPAFYGLSPNEISVLEKLPWKLGSIRDILDREYVFYPVSGKIKTQNGCITGPTEDILGVLPFCENPKEKYEEMEQTKVRYLPAPDLAKFFLRYPKAMYSFIRMKENKGSRILNRWKNTLHVKTFFSETASWQAIHCAYNCAYRIFNKTKENVLYLEFQPDGLSVFSLLGLDIPPALLQSRSTEDLDLSLLLDARIFRQDGVDILNIQHLSIWKMVRSQWASLFWELQSRYKHIVIHGGDEMPDYLLEESDIAYVFTQSRDFSLRSDLWTPVLREISTKEKNGLSYPINHAKLVDINKIPRQNDLDDNYWNWMDEYILTSPNEREAYVLSGQSLQDPEEIQKSSLPILSESGFANEVSIITEGSISLGCYLWQTQREFPGERKSKNKKHVEELYAALKPKYPERGFYSTKSFARNFQKGLQNERMGRGRLIFAAYHYESESVRLMSMGNFTENLASAILPPGILEELPGKSRPHCMQSGHRTQLLALLLRLGFRKVNFCRLEGQSGKPSFLKNLIDCYFENPGHLFSVSGHLSSIQTYRVQEEDQVV